MVLIRPEQVKRATMDEQRGPKGAAYGRDFSPGGAAVARLKDVGHGAAVLGAPGPKLVVGSDVMAVGQNGQAGRADVDARGGRAVVNDDARHNGTGSRERGVGPGVGLDTQAERAQESQELNNYSMAKVVHSLIRRLISPGAIG